MRDRTRDIIVYILGCIGVAMLAVTGLAIWMLAGGKW